MAKIYRKRGNKLNEVVTFDSACTRQENQPLVYDATDGSVHTTTHIGCLDANDLSVNNLTVTGQAIIQEQVTDTIDSNTLVLRSNADAGLSGTENSGVIIHNYNGSEDLYAVTDNTGTFRVGTAASTTTTYAYLRYNETDNKWYSTAPGVTPAVEVTPVGSPTSWDSVVTSGDDVEYTNIVFSVIDRTSLEPLTTRDESTDMEKDYLTKWNSTDEKIITTGTSCTHDLCANGDITSTGDITAEGNVCVKTNITVDGNSCVSGDSTVSGEIHSCKCITAPTACVSSNLYVAGDINNCNTNSIIHGYYGCFENNVCIKGDLAIDGTIAVSSLTSDHVISVENTTNSPFYLPFVQNNHLVAGSNDLYTNGDLQYNPSTDVLCTKTFCSDRGIVQSAFSGVKATDLGLTANTAYSLSTIVSCLQACYGDKAVSYSFRYENATNPRVTEYGNDYAYYLTFEKLDNNSLSGTYTKSKWLVTAAKGTSWTVTGTTGSTAGAITWSVCEHVVDQVCVDTASNNQAFPLIFTTCQSTPSCSKKTLYTDSANNLMYNPSTNTLKTCCLCACCDSYHARINSAAGSTCYAKITLNSDSLGGNTAHLTFDVYGTKFELGVKEIALSSVKMSISYFTKTGDYGITCANVTTGNSRDILYIKYSGYRNINITSDIPIKSITTSSTAPSDVSSTSWCAPTYDNATQYVNVTNTNGDFPILFNDCQATPAAGCKTLYNDSANNLMYNPSTNTLTTNNACISTNACVGNNFQVGSAVGCTSSVTGTAGFKIYGQGGGMDIYSSAPYLNFHVYNSSSNSHCLVADYGHVKLTTTNGYGKTAATQSAVYYFCSDGYIYANGLSANVPTANTTCNLTFIARCRNASGLTAYDMCLCGSNGVLYNPQGFGGPLGLTKQPMTYVDSNISRVDNVVGLRYSKYDAGNCAGYPSTFGNIFTAQSGNASNTRWGYQIALPTQCTHIFYRNWTNSINVSNSWNQLIDSTGGQTINGDLTATGTICAAFCGNVTATYLQVCDMTIASSTSTPISLTCGSYKVRIDNYDNIVIGCNTSTSGSGNIAIGKTVCASSYGVAIGCNTYAYNSAVAIGCNARGCSDCSVAIGANVNANINCSIAIGANANANRCGPDGSGAYILVDERFGLMRRSIICWTNTTKQCDLFNAIYCRFSFNMYSSDSQIFFSVIGQYGCTDMSEIRWDCGESPKNIDFYKDGGNRFTVSDGCTCAISKAGWVQIINYAR